MESHGKSKDSKVFEMFQKHASDLLTSADDQILGLILEAGSVSVFTGLVEQDYDNFYKKMMNCPDLMNAINIAVAEEPEGNNKIDKSQDINNEISSSASSSSIIDEKDDDNIIPLNEDKWKVPKADMERAIKESLEISNRVKETNEKAITANFFGTLDENGFDKEDVEKAVEKSKKSYEKENDKLRSFGGAHMGRTLDKFDDEYAISKEAQQHNFFDHMNSGGAIPSKGLNAKPKCSVKKPSWFKRFCNWVKNWFTQPVEEGVGGIKGFDLMSNYSDDSVSTVNSEDKNKGSFVKSINNIKEDREYDLNSSNMRNSLDYDLVEK